MFIRSVGVISPNQYCSDNIGQGGKGSESTFDGRHICMTPNMKEPKNLSRDFYFFS